MGISKEHSNSFNTRVVSLCCGWVQSRGSYNLEKALNFSSRLKSP